MGLWGRRGAYGAEGEGYRAEEKVMGQKRELWGRRKAL